MELEMREESQNYRSVNENPCHMCMPLGGILAFMGIEKTMVILHGSQGCSTYMRRHIAEHFNEPIDVASSSLNEKGTIYGGESNLKTGLDNLIKLYQPKAIGVLTTCLAETIGEDVERITANYCNEKRLDDFPIISAPTPGYGGTHNEGYWQVLRKITASLSRDGDKHDQFNIVLPQISPADVREIKRLLSLMKVKYTLLPDIGDNLDRPWTRSYEKLASGGTRIEDIRRMPGAPATIEMGLMVEDNLSPGRYLKEKYGVPFHQLPLPIGIENTDRFLKLLSEITGNLIPEVLHVERGRLLDCMVDSHKHNSRGKVTIFGDPEMVYALAATCKENGIAIAVLATGSKNKRLSEMVRSDLQKTNSQLLVMNEADFAGILENSGESGVNLAIGHSGGKFLEEKGDIALLRIGFPIHDRMGGQRILSVGYNGTIILLDKITNSLLENLHQNYRSNMYKQFYKGTRRRPVLCKKQ